MNCYYFYCPNAFEYLKGTYYASVWADDKNKARKQCSDYLGECHLLPSKPKDAMISSLY